MIGHKNKKILDCSKYFYSPQILFYTTFCRNPKSGLGPKIRVSLGPSWSPAQIRVPVDPRIRTVQLWQKVYSVGLKCVMTKMKEVLNENVERKIAMDAYYKRNVEEIDITL